MLLAALNRPSPKDLQAVEAAIGASGALVARIPQRDEVLFLCQEDEALSAHLAQTSAVDRLVSLKTPYLLSARDAKRERSRVKLSEGLEVGGQEFVVIAGPCSVESAAQTLTTAVAVQAAGARALRGGAFKPRTSPFSFQGLGEEGLRLLSEARAKTGLPVVSELLDVASLPVMDQAVDVLQVGMRNAQNYPLLRALGRLQSQRPVLLKCGTGMGLDELLCAADYLLSGGNPNVILCLRGSVGFSTHGRCTLNAVDIPALRKRTHLPIIVDPSHAAGTWEYVPALSAAALAAGADGLLIEVHHDPKAALSDAEQALRPDHFHRLMHRLRALAPCLGRTIAPALTDLEVDAPMAELCLEPPTPSALSALPWPTASRDTRPECAP